MYIRLLPQSIRRTNIYIEIMICMTADLLKLTHKLSRIMHPILFIYLSIYLAFFVSQRFDEIIEIRRVKYRLLILKFETRNCQLDLKWKARSSYRGFVDTNRSNWRDEIRSDLFYFVRSVVQRNNKNSVSEVSHTFWCKCYAPRHAIWLQLHFRIASVTQGIVQILSFVHSLYTNSVHILSTLVLVAQIYIGYSAAVLYKPYL